MLDPPDSLSTGRPLIRLAQSGILLLHTVDENRDDVPSGGNRTSHCIQGRLLANAVRLQLSNRSLNRDEGAGRVGKELVVLREVLK